MSKFLGKRAKQEPYVYGEQPKDKKYIKINTNENPYCPSPKAMELLKNTDAQLGSRKLDEISSTANKALDGCKR